MVILKELGVRFTGNTPATAGAFVTGGKAHKLPSGPMSLLSTGALSVRAKLEVGRLLTGINRIDTRQLAATTVASWIEGRVKTEETRELLRALFRLATSTNAPEVQSAGAAISQLQLALKSNVLYLDGGWQTLVDGLRTAAVDAGAAIERGAAVTELEPNAPGWRLHRRNHAAVDADAVVLALAPGEARTLIANEALDGWSDDATPARAAVMDVCLSSLPNPKTAFALGGNAPLYLQVHSRYAALAPDGGVLISLLKYLPIGERSDSAHDERELQALLDLVQPGWRAVVLHRRFLPSMTAMGSDRAGGPGWNDGAARASSPGSAGNLCCRRLGRSGGTPGGCGAFERQAGGGTGGRRRHDSQRLRRAAAANFWWSQGSARC